MSCGSKRSMPRDETEDLAILRLTVKRLEDLEHERYVKTKSSRMLDISQLENQILSNGYSKNLLLQSSTSQSLTSLHQELATPLHSSLFEMIEKLKGDVKLLEDECQVYKLRMESLQESEDRHLKAIERLKKELQITETCQYKSNDQIECLKQKIDRLQGKIVLKAEEVDRITEENRMNEERLSVKIAELERDTQAHRVTLINLSTKHTLTEADRLKLEGEYAERCRENRRLQFQVKDIEEKLKVYQEAEKNIGANVIPRQTTTGIYTSGDERKCGAVKSGNCLVRDQSRYNAILCFVSSYLHQWNKASEYLVVNGEDEYKIARILGKIMQVAYKECRKSVEKHLLGNSRTKSKEHSSVRNLERSGLPSLFDLSIEMVEINSTKIFAEIYKVVDASLMSENSSAAESGVLENFKKFNIIALWKLLAKFRDVYLEGQGWKISNEDVGIPLCERITIWPEVFLIKSK
ncbi:uncharacterized protein LOC125679224 isoform X3 [Ostrea edulis]|uniref:uncharacterized protein LOC125679224 isoform X3 n=1 Tax=Ostrea edulis TaxID=37623 RepID=UPI0020941076|nr:uncharacterized protein LOC125679224 isoform X3 [Ostrea edulis]